MTRAISVRIGGGEKETRAHTHMHTCTYAHAHAHAHARTHAHMHSQPAGSHRAAVDGPGSDARRLGREATRMRGSDGQRGDSDARLGRPELGRKATRMRDSDGRSSNARRPGRRGRTRRS